MNNDFEIKGFWWLPEIPENKVPGNMSFSPGKLIVIELMGDLNKVKSQGLQDFINPPIIQGVSSQGKLVTLYKCTQTQSTTSMAGFPSTSFIALYAYVGVHFLTSDEVRFKGLSVRFHNLDEWFNKRPFDLQSPRRGSEVVTYKQPMPIKTLIGDFHVDFVILGPSSSFDPTTHVTLSQEARVNIWSDGEKLFEEFLPTLRLIQNFLTLAMIDPTFITEMTGTTEKAKEIYPDHNFHTPVEIYYPADGWRAQVTKQHWFQMLFILPTIEEQLSTILETWIEKAEIIKPVYDLYFSALYNPSTYTEFHFLSLAQAIETYHRQVYGGKYQTDDKYLKGLYKTLLAAIPLDVGDDFRNSLKIGKLRYANEFSLRKRLNLIGEHLAGRININFLVDKKQRGIFADKVTDSRNYLTHYSPELKEKAAIGAQELHELIEKLRLVLQICFLEEVGFSFEIIEEIFKSNREFRQYFS